MKNYSLSIVLFLLFAFSWIAQGVFQFQEFVNHSQEHGQEPKIEEFWPDFFSATFENWQSEFLQLLAFVVLTTYLIHKNSPESRDSQDKLEKEIQTIKTEIKALRRR